MWPPSILRVRVAEDGKRGISLWIPLFLIWPLILLACCLAPVVVALSPGLRRGVGGTSVALSGVFLFGAFCSARGMRVDARNERDCVFVALW